LLRVLGLDLGSSSVRALVMDAETLDPVPGLLARRDMGLVQAPDGSAEFDADDCLAAMVSCVDELSGSLAGVGTVAFSTQWHSLLGLSATGQPVGPGLSWLDTRPSLIGPGPVDPKAFHARTGAWWHPFYWPARLRWLASAGVTAARWVGLPEYVTLRLLGVGDASVSSASGTGALDTVHCRWDAEAVSLAAVRPDALPGLLPDGWTGRLVPEYARRWPELARADWAAPLGDGAASTLASGCLGPDRVSVTVGTSAAVRLVMAGAPEPGPNVWRYRVDTGRSVLGVAYSAGGVLYDWLTEVLPPGSADVTDRVPGDHGLVVLPHLAGHRPPHVARGGGGTVHGVRLSTRAGDLAAAVLEGLCHELADGVAAVAPGAQPVLGGGAVAASPWLARRLAAALPPGARLVTTPEVGARGAAMVATGRYPDPPLPVVEHTEAERSAMAAAALRHRSLRARLG
jgi:gluconokinase